MTGTASRAMHRRKQRCPSGGGIIAEETGREGAKVGELGNLNDLPILIVGRFRRPLLFSIHPSTL